MSPPTVSTEEDVDSTAELPTLEVPAAAPATAAALRADGSDGHHTRTDTWILPQPTLPDAERLRELDAQQQSLRASIQTLTAELREASDLLAAKDERLRQVEAARDEAQVAHAGASARIAGLQAELEAQRSPPGPQAAAEERLRLLDAELEQQRSTSTRQAQELEEAARVRAASDERLAALQAELEQHRTASAQHGARAEELTRQQAQSEARASQLGTELDELRTAGSGHAQQLADAARAHADSEQRLQESTAQAAQLRAELTATQERSTQQQRELAGLRTDTEARQTQQLQLHQAEVARGRAHSDELQRQLEEERARSARYLESLSSLESRRRIVEELMVDLDRSGSSREGELEGVRRDLAARGTRLTELDTELSQRASRIARLEQQLNTFKETLAQRDTQLREAQRESEGLQASVTRLQGELAQGAERLRTHATRIEQQSANDVQQQEELQRLRTESQELRAALESARGAAASAHSQANSHDSAIAQQRERTQQAEAALGAERERATQLESELATLRGEMDDWGGVLRSAQNHLATIAEAEARVRRLEGELVQQREATRTVESQAAAHAARVLELQGDLQSATSNVSRLEAELSRVQAAERAPVPAARLSGLEAQHGSTDTANNPALLEAARSLMADLDATEIAPLPLRETLRGLPADPDATEIAPAALRHAARGAAEADVDESAPAPDGAVRLLIHMDGEREVVHVLGRKTSIGRTPDNDLQLDTKFVSRHHAVILAGPVHTIIEDLNSTNGVLINGRRIVRHTLSEGDTIAIGRTQYRFAVRRGSDKR
jgi:chromosome segregation ATPase